MAIHGWAACCCALTLCLSVHGAQEDCKSLGFSGMQLCSDCDQLGKFIQDEELIAECKQCCAQDAQESTETYQKGVLEVCPHGIKQTPHLETFVNKHINDYPSLTLRTRLGAPPRLILTNPGDKHVIRIDNWKTEHLIAYLNERLRTPQGGDAPLQAR